MTDDWINLLLADRGSAEHESTLIFGQPIEDYGSE